MNNEEILLQVLNRADEIKYKKIEKRRKIGAAALVTLSGTFIVVLSVAMPYIMQNIDKDNINSGTPVASLLSNPAFAGYVMVGVITFILGVSITMLCYKWKKKNERK